MGRLFLIGLIPLLLALGACDSTSGPPSLDQQPPEVSNLAFAPDSVVVAELPPERVSNGQATIQFAMEVTAQDPDGTIDRVVFTIEPASNPSGTAQGTLQQLNGNQYGAAGEIGLSATRTDIYTVRVFAIDNDEQVGNQVLAQLHLIAPSNSE